MKENKGRHTLLPGLLVSCGFLYWFVHDAHWQEIKDCLVGISPFWVMASVGVLYSEFFIRSLRWKALLQPLAPQARLGRLFVATIVGMSLNVVLPFRAGDLARPWLGDRETGIGIAPLVTIAVLERIFDIIGLFSVFVLMLATLPSQGAAEGVLVQNLKFYGSILGICGALGLGTFFVLAFQRQRLRFWVEAKCEDLPGPLRRKLLGLYDGLCNGLEVIRSPMVLLQALLLSWIHWLNGSIAIYLLFQAFSLDLPYPAACFTTVAIALAAALPQAPGFVGVFHSATENTLLLWGQGAAPSKAFAIVFWGVSFVPIAVSGLLFFWRENLRLSEIQGTSTTSSKGE